MPAELLKALKLAYEAEVEGLKSYLNYAKQTNVGSAKNMFVQLALDEVDHMGLIQGFIDKTMNGETYEVVDVPKGRLSKFMPNIEDAKLSKAEEATVTDEQALKIALKHEEKAGKFYEGEAAKATDPAVKSFFEKMAEVEQKHYDIIQAELNFIKSAGCWFDTMEFSLEGE